ncbi:MAG TPA: hypothetical protein VNV66_11145 [Pilimelia sp.]|nr:hypothetical protein [Pilimelia sp.]
MRKNHATMRQHRPAMWRNRRVRLGGVLVAATVAGASLLSPAGGAAARAAGATGGAPPRPGTVTADPNGRHLATRSAGALDRPYHLARGVAAEPRAGSAGRHTVTIRGVDRDGAATAPEAELIELSSGVAAPLAWTGTALTATVAPGDYTLTAAVLTGPDPFNPTDITLYAEPTLRVTGDLSVTIDARTAQPVRAEVPVPTAARVTDRAAVVQRVAGQVLTSYANGDADTTLHALPSRTTATRDYAFLYMAAHAEPPAAAGSRAYYLGFPTLGGIPRTLTFAVAAGGLATVHARYLSQGVPPSGPGNRNELIAFDTVPFTGVFGLERPVAVPGTATEYFTATGVRWRGNLFTPVGTHALYEEQTAFRAFTPGAATTESWNAPAFGPSVQVGHGAGSLVVFANPAQTGQPGRDALPGTEGASSTIRLFRNNSLVGQSTQPLYGEFAVPATAADFRLELTVSRTPTASRYATRTTARWSFRSSGTGDPLDQLRQLPHIRATGAFDLTGRAPGGSAFPLDITAEPSGASVSGLTAQVTYNDGASWTAVGVTPTAAGRWRATVNHPRTGHNGYVGLRFTATDGTGSTLTHTTLRAYGLS